MKSFLLLCCLVAAIATSARAASACNQTLADTYDRKIRVAIDTRDNAALARYAVQQAAIYHVCAGENSGAMRTRYLLGEAASWDQAAQALHVEGQADSAATRSYAHKALEIAKPIAASGNVKDKKAATAIIWTLNWVHGG